MCRTCDKIRSLSPEKALEAIGDEVKKGKNPEHFKRLMDGLLGTEEPAQNPDLDEAWETSNRSQ
jgi:hypothetical protein